MEVPEATKCGIGPCHPQCLQIFASKKFFTFMLCIFGLIEGALISGESSILTQLYYSKIVDVLHVCADSYIIEIHKKMVMCRLNI